MLRVVLAKQAKKAILKVQPKRAQRVRDAIEKFATDPTRRDLDLKKLVSRPGYRLRIGELRVIFEIEGDTLCVLYIGARQHAYKA